MGVTLEDLAERFNSLCRFCLSDDDCLPIFLEDNNFNERLQEGFEIIASKVDENDGLPNNICSSCMQCIADFISFEAKCSRSYDILEQVLERSVERHLAPLDVSEINEDCNTFPETEEKSVDLQEKMVQIEEPVVYVSEKQNDFNEPDDTMNKEYQLPEQIDEIGERYTIDVEKCIVEREEGQVDMEEEYIIDYEDGSDTIELDEGDEDQNEALLKLEVEISTKAHANEDSGSERIAFAKSVEHLTEDEKKIFLEAADVKAQDWVFRAGRKIAIVECTFCNKTYRGRNTLRKHLKLHFKIKNYACHFCTRSFSDRSSLRLHEFRHSKVKSFKCKQCDRAYYCQSELKQHCVLQHDERRFVCQICNAKFPLKAILEDHINVHMSHRPYVCTICGFAFKRNRNLARHLVVHNKENPRGKLNGCVAQKAVSCQYCSSLFEIPSELLKHLIEGHPLEYERTRDGTHDCKYCGTSFDELDKCLMHQNKHYVFPVVTSGGKIYQCGECGRQLRYKSLAQKHLLSHSTKRMFACSYKGCLKKYKHKIHYTRHIREAHESTE